MKKLIFIILLLAGCTVKQEIKFDHAAENEKIVRAMFDAFNQHDWDKMASYYSDSALFLDPSFGTEYVTQDRTKLADKYREMHTVFPDIHDEVVGLYASEDKITAEFVSTGTAPDSTKFKLPIVSILTIENGKIVKDATYYDNSH
jgi:ketosteroid isomerase-like protein